MKLFLPQSTLEEWALDDKADLQDGKLVVPAEKGAYALTPAVRFVKLVTGEDEKKLEGRVKTQAQLGELGAEQMMDSVILGESAYEIVPGFVAELPESRPAAARPTTRIAPETDLLAQFLLNKL
jgi:hypothetical protein